MLGVGLDDLNLFQPKLFYDFFVVVVVGIQGSETNTKVKAPNKTMRPTP